MNTYILSETATEKVVRNNFGVFFYVRRNPVGSRMKTGKPKWRLVKSLLNGHKE